MELGDLTRGQAALLRADAPRDAVLAIRNVDPGGPVLAAQAFLAASIDEARFLVLLGEVGVGKTVAAVLVMSEIMRRVDTASRPSGGESGKWPAGMFIRSTAFARLSMFESADKQWFEQMLRTNCLVLDDIGSEMVTEPFKAQLYELLDTRYARGRRTVITSNLNKASFAKRYGERITDRLREKGISDEFKGPSLRRQA